MTKDVTIADLVSAAAAAAANCAAAKTDAEARKLALDAIEASNAALALAKQKSRKG